ncbi:MAG TPA: hypothetical protein VGB30_12230 [bacterium]
MATHSWFLGIVTYLDGNIGEAGVLLIYRDIDGNGDRWTIPGEKTMNFPSDIPSWLKGELEAQLSDLGILVSEKQIDSFTPIIPPTSEPDHDQHLYDAIWESGTIMSAPWRPGNPGPSTGDVGYFKQGELLGMDANEFGANHYAILMKYFGLYT